MGSASSPGSGAGRTVLLALEAVAFAVAVLSCDVSDISRDELEARRLIGKAYYENDKFDEASREFRRCIELDGHR